MRTTLDIDDAVLDVARALARDSGISIGAAVSLLAQRGMSRPVSKVDGLPVFEVSGSVSAITEQMVREALEEG